MAYAIIAFDGPDPSRRAAVRDRHLGVITDWARDGRLALGVPLFDAAWQPVGSLMVVSAGDPSGLDAYLAAEPFATDGVWARWTAHPGRIAPLPYRPLPQPGTPVSPTRTHTVMLALDGTDDGALARRMAVREAHMARVRGKAADGTLALGCALLDAPDGRMIGSVTVTAHDSDEAARAFWNADPYVTGGVWQEITMWGTRFAPLPYQPLPGAA